MIGPGVKINVAFLRANKRHHSVAAAQINGKRLNHFQLETTNRNNVGLSYDRVRKSKFTIAHHVGVILMIIKFPFMQLPHQAFSLKSALKVSMFQKIMNLLCLGDLASGDTYKARLTTFLSNQNYS